MVKIEIEETKHVSWIDPIMKDPIKHATEKEWGEFKKFFQRDDNSKLLLVPFNLYASTPIHQAAFECCPKLLQELLGMLPPADRRRALRKKNAQGNTPLHEAIFNKNSAIAEVIFKAEQQLPPPAPEAEDEIDDESEEEKKRPLVEIENDLGETPIYRAAKLGKLNALICMAGHTNMDSECHLRRHDDDNILHVCVIGRYFEVALWLFENISQSQFDKLVEAKNKEKMTPLQMLSRMPEAFYSQYSPSFLDGLIYYILPYKRYNFDDNESECRDVESGRQEKANKPKSGIMALMSNMYYAIWDRLSKEREEINRKGINRIWHEKNQHKLAKKLAEHLVEKDRTWLDSHNRQEKEAKQSAVLPCSVIVGKQQREKRERLIEKREKLREKREEIKKPDKDSADFNPRSYEKYTPLLIAASMGIEEIVKEIIEKHPGAIVHVSHDQQNVLHMAVKHRQLNIYEVIEERKNEFQSLVVRINDAGRSVLHQAASMDYYREGHVPGVAYQLQEELRWFDRVKRRLPERYLMHSDEDNLTAGDVLDIEHEVMHKDAKNWIKETAQSCSAVAVLVATVVFAAAYTAPGGTAENGLPKFLHSPVFLFFTIMDIVGLASSLAAVVTFLSILSSPFEMWDFHVTLPRKLRLGFFMLFLSLTATMLAFSATIVLTVKLEKKKWTSTLIYSGAFFPVTIFGLLQFPLYIRREKLRYLGKLFKKALRQLKKMKIN